MNLSDADFKQQDLAFFNHGLRLERIGIGGPGFSGIWRPGTGTQWVRHGLSWDDFKQQNLDFFNQGLRVHEFDVWGPSL